MDHKRGGGMIPHDQADPFEWITHTRIEESPGEGQHAPSAHGEAFPAPGTAGAVLPRFPAVLDTPGGGC